MDEQALLWRIALSRAKYVGPTNARILLEGMGSIENIFASRDGLRKQFPRLQRRVLEALFDPNLMREAKNILGWCISEGVSIRFVQDEDYPPLLRECADPPVVVYTKGNVDFLQSDSILSVVGTRNITSYGSQTTDRLLTELNSLLPGLIIVSGLAYGIDIAAHRKAMSLGMPTIAVLAHGLDRIYPSVHRREAMDMLSNGGWMTEYPPGTKPERFNFVGRNRIIAGLSQATLVVEAGMKSGSLITAELAADYDRAVFAIPGRIGDKYSEGCNKLISQMRGILTTSGEDIVRELGMTIRENIIEQTLLFPDPERIDHPILRIIAEAQPIHHNDLVLRSGLSSSELGSVIFELEMDGHIKSIPGGLYRLA